VRPLGAAVPPLEGVVVEFRAEGQSQWELAQPQESERARARNLVHVAYDQHIVPVGFLRGSDQVGEDVGEQGVAEEVLVVPDARALDWIRDDAVDDLVVEGSELGPVLPQVQGFGFAGEGCWGLDYDEVVDLVGEGVQADFEPVQFGGHED